MYVHPLDPPRGLITPLGDAIATEMIIWGQEDYFYYSCWQLETGENWMWDNRYVRLDPNISAGHPNISPFPPTITGLYPHIMRHKKSPLYREHLDSTGAGCNS